jgi:hypothetical protein
MNCPLFMVGDGVRMRHPASHASNTIGTVIMVYSTAPGYYDVTFDAVLGTRVCYVDDIEHSPDEENTFWTDETDDRHHGPTMRDLPPLLRLGIKRMVAVITGNPAARQDQATEAANILLCVLLPRVPQDEIDRYPYCKKRHFVVSWCSHQHIPFVTSV